MRIWYREVKGKRRRKITEKEGIEGFLWERSSKNTVVDHHLPPRTGRDNSTICPTESCPHLLRSYMLAPKFTEYVYSDLGRCNLNCSTSPWSRVDS